MDIATLDLPAGKKLECEIENIEAQSHDAAIRRVIAQRIAIADDSATTFVSHDDVVSTSRAHLLALLNGRVDT